MNIINFKDQKIVDKYDKNPLAWPYIFYPALFRARGNIHNKYILDIGCGSGWFSEKLSQKGARVLAVDNSSKWMNICETRYKKSSRLKFALADCKNLSFVGDKKFDIVFANMLFLSIASRKTVEKAFNQIGKVTKKGGVFIFNDIHPFAIVMPKTSIKRSGVQTGFSNFKEGFKCKTKYLMADYTTLGFTDAHWSLGFYSKLLKKNKFVIEEIIEPKPYRLDPKKKLKDYRIPDLIVFKCKKI